METSMHRTFWGVLAGTIVVRLILAAVIPMTSDEAHFVLWGRYLAGGYFDHPPMIGWILYLMEHISSAPVVLRLPPIVATSVVGYGIYRILRPVNPATAVLTAVLFLISPINILNVIVTTDTPLFLFIFLSGSCFYFAERKGQYLPLYALAGAFLGLAFLSKYLSALLGVAYVVHWMLSPKTTRRTAGITLLFASLMPFVAYNLAWNYFHGWPNIMFNVFNRNRSEGFSVEKILIFFACQAYLMAPVLYYAVKRRKDFRFTDPALRAVLAAFVVPLGIFAVLSTKKVIGLHWPLSYYSFMYLAVGFVLSAGELRRSIRFTAWFTGVHLVLIVSVLSLPVSVLKHNKNFNSVVIGMYPQKLLAALAPYGAEYAFATLSYADSNIIEYHLHRHVAVFGTGSYHARHDDFVTDYNTLAGKNILILRSSTPRVEEYAPYFETVDIRPVTIEGAPFYFVLGRNFNLDTYKARVLSSIRDQFYAIPSWLPYRRSDFLDKYFPPAPASVN